MKNVMILVAALSLLSSCSTVHKLQEQNREKKAARMEKKSESTSEIRNDSSGTSQTTAVTTSTVTTTVDTNIHIPGQTLTGFSEMPDAGDSITFSDGDLTTVVGVDSAGKLQVKTTSKDRDVAVKKTTTAVSNSSVDTRTTAQTSSQEHTTTRSVEKIDSNVKRSVVKKEKQVQRPGGGWSLLWIAAVVVLLIVLWYKFWG